MERHTIGRTIVCATTTLLAISVFLIGLMVMLSDKPVVTPPVSVISASTSYKTPITSAMYDDSELDSEFDLEARYAEAEKRCEGQPGLHTLSLLVDSGRAYDYSMPVSGCKIKIDQFKKTPDYTEVKKGIYRFECLDTGAYTVSVTCPGGFSAHNWVTEVIEFYEEPISVFVGPSDP